MDPIEEIEKKIKNQEIAYGYRPRWVRVSDALYAKLLYLFATWEQKGLLVKDSSQQKLAMLRPSWSGVTIVSEAQRKQKARPRGRAT